MVRSFPGAPQTSLVADSTSRSSSVHRASAGDALAGAGAGLGKAGRAHSESRVITRAICRIRLQRSR
jgi:hypothetical protein